MLVLLFVALWFILRGDLLYVFPCVILFLCFSVLLVLRLPRLGKRELILVLFVRLFGLCLFRFVGFLFLLGSGKGCGLWLWHSLDFSLTIFGYSKTHVKRSLNYNSSNLDYTALRSVPCNGGWLFPIPLRSFVLFWLVLFCDSFRAIESGERGKCGSMIVFARVYLCLFSVFIRLIQLCFFLCLSTGYGPCF